jgi:hypothetical protein
MEAFLERYGFRWRDKSGSFDPSQVKSDIQNAPLFNFGLPAELDVRQIEFKVLELNRKLRGEGNRGGLLSHGNVKQLAAETELPLFLFKNGLILKGH